MNEPIIIIYYKYTRLDRPKDHMIQQRAVCADFGLKGRILIAQEGINGTLEGEKAAIEKYIAWMNQHPDYANINYKKSSGTGKAFPKLIVKVRKEIVTSELGDQDVDPNQITGKYLSAQELNKWFKEGKKFKIVDMRNDYEQVVGQFEGSILPGMENFRDLKKVTENLKPLKDETIVTVCTFGVRCEKASGYLVTQGFKDVYQLHNGIGTYMEQFPNEHFKGQLYVFDNRIVMGFKTDAPEHETIGRCLLCNKPSVNYTNCADDECHKHFICCENCLDQNKLAFCKPTCKEKVYQKN